MRFPLGLALSVGRYMASQAIAKRRRFPTTLMLEPLYTCNLACVGCSTERHTGKLADRLTVAQCLEAVDQSKTPTLSLCGGEPTLYPELPELLDGLIQRGKYIFLCTNALAIERNLFDVVAPNKHLIVNVHLDGMRETHDFVCDRPGVFDHAVAMIGESKRRGYQTMTNTTVYQETSMAELVQLCELLMDLDVDGMLISPGYQYETVEQDIFLKRADIHTKFAELLKLSSRFPITATPGFLRFCAGQKELPCSPYSTVTRTPLGWKAPCYLIEEKYYDTWDEFWSSVDWAYWESRQDARCQNCYMHSGFEASAVQAAAQHPKEFLELMAWNLTKPRRRGRRPAAQPEAR